MGVPVTRKRYAPSGEPIPIGGRAAKKAARLAVGTTTSRVELPKNAANTYYDVYQLTALDDNVFWAKGNSTVTVDHTTDNCDDVLPAGATITISATDDDTHIAGIVEANTAVLIVAGVI